MTTETAHTSKACLASAHGSCFDNSCDCPCHDNYPDEEDEGMADSAF